MQLWSEVINNILIVPEFIYIHLYFTISVANNYNITQRNENQIEQASNVTSLQGQSRKFEQKIIDRVIFYEKSLSFIQSFAWNSVKRTRKLSFARGFQLHGYLCAALRWTSLRADPRSRPSRIVLRRISVNVVHLFGRLLNTRRRQPADERQY